MKLGIRQLTLLDRCRRKGYITVRDVDVVYNFSRPSSFEEFRRLNRHKFEIIHKLELLGYLEVKMFSSELQWQLTRRGLAALRAKKDEVAA